MTDLAALAERIEQAEGPSYVLDCEIAEAIGRAPMAFTASIDAAMTLVPATMRLIDLTMTWEPACPEAWPAVSVTWYPPHKGGSDWHALVAKGATPALALCSAALTVRARGEA